MQVKDIVTLEKDNYTNIYLLREGLFWRAYEKSAYLFTSHIKPYQLNKKYYKNVDCELVYCGFPAKALEKLIAKASGQEILYEENMISIIGFEQTDHEAFIGWKNGLYNLLEENEPAYSAYKNDQNLKDQVFKRIRNFNIASSTPLDCQKFLVELQKYMNGAV